MNMIQKPHFVRRTAAAAVAAGGIAIIAAGCGGSSDSATASSGSNSSGGSAQLNLVAYSTPKAAYGALTAAFQKTAAGKGVSFAQSFGASGAQSRAVDSGQPADVVAFSTEPDISRLVKDNIVASSWDSGPYQGNVADSVVVMVVRKGNPKHITGWSSLIQPGIKVVTPNPSTSGSARWNILAAYGAQLKQGKSPAQALAYVKTLISQHTAAEPSSASTALQAFTSGEGDVLLDYESDAIAAKKAGEPIQYIIPKQTILIQTPDAVTAKSKHAKQAQAFVNWLVTPQAQNIWAQQGYRPVVPSVLSKYSSEFPTPSQLFNISYLGGWTKAKSEFFDPSTGSVTKIEQAAGYPTASS
jgi:sulfate/thiosulfate transport system substrate-binding protein